jgi:hypothetical protein
MNLVSKNIILAWSLHNYFNKHDFAIDIDPMHPDGCCGLKKIGDVSMIFNTILFLLGIYLSLKVIDKIVIQHLPLTSDIGNPIFLGTYIVLAPILFFVPLNAPHRKMKCLKEQYLKPLTSKYFTLIKTVESSGSTDTYEEINKLEALITNLNKKVPVWPFNFKSLKAFFGTVIVPLLPVILPFALKIIIDWLKP